MQQGPRPKASQKGQTMAIRGKSQRVKGTQNSPNAGQDKAKNTLRWHPNGLSMEAYAMIHSRSIKPQLFKALKE